MSVPQQYSLNLKGIEREELPADVLLVGAGPANLACAIHLARLLKAKGIEGKSILVLEKAADVGDHTLSGAVMNPRGMAELFPDWRERGCPVEAEVTWDGFEVMHSKTSSKRLTGPFVPPQFKNKGKFIVAMNQVVGWMKAEAEKLGVQVFPGFPAAEILFDTAQGPDGHAVERVVGVQTRDQGLDKHGGKKASFQPGMNVRAPITVFGEGPRGHLAKHLVQRHALDQGKNPQTYGTGIKEIWELPPERGAEWLGRVLHTTGFPTGLDAYAGGWVYGLPGSRLSIGFVIGLDHWDAKLDPHALFVQWKQHPAIAKLLEGGKMLRYGAKTVPEGGYFAMPRLFGDGYVLVGDTAGFLNASVLKGVHLAIKSGMLAAEAIAAAFHGRGPAVSNGPADPEERTVSNGASGSEELTGSTGATGSHGAIDASSARLKRYDELFEASWAREELYRVRNWRQAFEGGVLAGMLDAGVQMVTGGRGLVGRRGGHADHTTTRPASMSRFTKPAYNDSNAMDKLTDVYHSGTLHDEDQPPHLLVLDTSICVTRCTEEFGNPCQHFCPAAVYEWPKEGAPAPGKGPTINFANCVHCKTCDIADPYENIEWVVPEGGGPKYSGM